MHNSVSSSLLPLLCFIVCMSCGPLTLSTNSSIAEEVTPKVFRRSYPSATPLANACGQGGKADARTIVIELCEIEITRRRFVES